MTTDNTNEASNELKEAAGKLKDEAQNASDAVKDAVAEVNDEIEHGGAEEFSPKRSLVLSVALPIGIIVGWIVVSATGGLGFEGKQAEAEKQSVAAKAPKVNPVAEEARRVASETAERVATRVSTDVATRVARDVASRVARDTAIQAIENVQ